MFLIKMDPLYAHHRAHALDPSPSTNVNTLFSLAYRIVMIDEVHKARLLGAFGNAIPAVTSKSAFNFVQTATPIFSSVLDLAHVASYLACMPEGDAVRVKKGVNNVYSQAKTSLALEKRSNRQGSATQGRSWCINSGLSGEELTDRVFQADGVRSSGLGAAMNLQEVDGKLSKECVALVDLFVKKIIRRTSQSLDYQGRLVLNLGQLHE